MSDELLATVELETGENPIASVIWLHGLGASGHDFPPIVPYLGLSPDLPTRFIFPHAPEIPVAINMGMVMPAWYDINDLDLDNRADEAGVRSSEAHVKALVAKEIERGIPTTSIILAGFSQGGAVAVHTALRFPEELAGLIALSTYLVCASTFDEERQAVNQKIPVFQGHGKQDPMVPFSQGQKLHNKLDSAGYKVDFQSYDMQHEVVMEEIQAIGRFINQCLLPS